MEFVRPIPDTKIRKGCNPAMATQRSKMQSRRMNVNQQLCKQMRLRAGAENLFNASSNDRVRETCALELSFVNSNLQLLKEELSEINSSVDPYQNKSGKTVSIPMLPLGLKDTNELEYEKIFEDFILEHYSEDPSSYSDQLADFADLRNSVKTPARTMEGVELLIGYYNQLYFIENRFFPPHRPLGVYFHWYDSITGVPSVQRSVSLEQASILFNVASLYSQIGTRSSRTKRKGIDAAIDSFCRAAGAFHYIRMNFSNAPTPDLSHNFLSAVTQLMLAQAQECVLERKVLGGFEIQLGKCASIAQEAMKVSEKYESADRTLSQPEVKGYVPMTWVNMVQVKGLHYRALAHFYAALGLLEQHEAAEPLEISTLLSTLYLGSKEEEERVGKRKEDRRRLGKSHLRQAISYHERALQTHSLCKMMRSVDVLKEYLKHAHNRSVAKFGEIDHEEDFFELVDAPEIQPCTENDTETIAPSFGSVTTDDIFRKMGPLGVFSARQMLSSARRVHLTNEDDIYGFTLKGEAPVVAVNLDQRARDLGMRYEDVIVAVNGVDVKWCDHNFVRDLLAKLRGSQIVLKLVSKLGIISPPATSGYAKTNGFTSIPEGTTLHYNSNNNNHSPTVRMRNSANKSNSIKKRHSFNFFQGTKQRNKPVRSRENKSDNLGFSTLPDKRKEGRSLYSSTTSSSGVGSRPRVNLERSATTSRSFLRGGKQVFDKYRREPNYDAQRSQC